MKKLILAMSRQKHQIPDYLSNGNGSFSMAYHTDMVRDHSRVEPFYKALQSVIKKDTRVLECGCGTGILSIMAAQLGAKVTTIEVDRKIAQYAKNNFSRLGLDIDLIEGDAMSLNPPEEKDKYDVVLAELMSIWCIDEPQVPVVNYVKEHFLKSSGVIIPGRIINLLSVGHFNFGNELVQCRFPMARFTGVPDATLFAVTAKVNELDFSSHVPMEMSGVIELESLVSGTINCVQISSLVELVPNVNFYTSDTLMPVTILPLECDIEVCAGDKVKIKYSYIHRSNIDSATFSATIA